MTRTGPGSVPLFIETLATPLTDWTVVSVTPGSSRYDSLRIGSSLNLTLTGVGIRFPLSSKILAWISVDSIPPPSRTTI